MQSSPTKKAVLYAILCAVIAVTAFAVLVLVVLYVPENRLLRRSSSKDNALAIWMPQDADLPDGMILIRDNVNSNRDISQNYDDQQQMLERLDGEFERNEGITRIYASKDRCRQVGPRNVSFNLTLHRSSDGASRYLYFIKDRVVQDGSQVESFKLGNEAYTILSRSMSYCSETENEIYAEVTLQQDNYLFTVSLNALEDENQPDEMFEILMPLAQGFKQRLSQGKEMP